MGLGCTDRGDASGRLIVDLDALVQNYRTLQAIANPAEVGAVVKANAYGLGAAPVSRALARAGCRHFFVAQLAEAASLHPELPSGISIYVLNGLWPGSEAQAAALGVVPVLNSLGQAARWREVAQARGARLPAVLQVDTGMSRLGVSPDEAVQLADAPDLLDHVDVQLVMTHLACADTSGAPATAAQRVLFQRLAALFPAAARSYANSAAALTLPGAPGELVRAGIALYGASPVTDRASPLRRVVTVTARVVQIRTIGPGAGVGYGLTYVASEPVRLATVAAGYADGWPRSLSGCGAVYLNDQRLPVLGRISMDSMMVDASALSPGALSVGDEVELIGASQNLEEVAALAGTISYEILTRLGSRYARSYVGAPALSQGSPA